ncbi:MAG: hypothetical protein IPI34_01110, partial [bacterium]|nr:hypothetical protein [bacterium]
MNYWDLLAEARARLDEGDLRGAESSFTEAAGSREHSPVRVFLSEKMGSAAKRALTRLRGAGAAEKGEAGRWDRERDAFVASYREQARGLLDRARTSVATPGTFPPRERLHLAAGAAYLTATSELADLRRIDPSPFLEAALAAACDGGCPPPDGLLAVSLPLAADVRCGLAARTLEFARRGAADEAVRGLARDADALLAPEHMVGPAQEAERLWLSAQLADGPLDDARRAPPDLRRLLAAGGDARRSARPGPPGRRRPARQPGTLRLAGPALRRGPGAARGDRRRRLRRA